MKLAQARIVTDDAARLIGFYKALTGLGPAGDERYAEFHGPGLSLAISSQEALDLYGAGATRPRANQSMILDFEVDDVDAERTRLQALVGHFVLEPSTRPWGNRSMLFRDPDGNLINMYSVPRRARE